MKLKSIFPTLVLVTVLHVPDGTTFAQGSPPGGNGGNGGGRGMAGMNFGGGNFDPAQMQQQIEQMAMDFYREQLEVKDDAEWKVIGDEVKKVMNAQRLTTPAGSGNLLRAAMRNRGNQGGQGAQDATQGNRRRNNNPGLDALLGSGASEPELDALQRAIDAKASNADLKAAMDKYRDARKQKLLKLEQAQDSLRKLLSVRQEAVAVALGLI